MKKLYRHVLLLAAFSAMVSSCKMDAPVLPKDIQVKDPSNDPGTNPGTKDPVNTVGLPIGEVNALKMQLNAATGVQTYNDQINFTTILGVNTITARLNSDMVSIGYVGDKTGTFDLLICNIGDYEIQPDKPGKIEITVSTMDAYSKGIIKGGYEAELINPVNGLKQPVRGSFNIKQ